MTITAARQLTLSAGVAWFTTDTYWGKVYVNTDDINSTLPVADGVLDRICRGVILRCDGGGIWLKRGSPWCQALRDEANDKIKRRYINVTAEFLTQN